MHGVSFFSIKLVNGINLWPRKAPDFIFVKECPAVFNVYLETEYYEVIYWNSARRVGLMEWWVRGLILCIHAYLYVCMLAFICINLCMSNLCIYNICCYILYACMYVRLYAGRRVRIYACLHALCIRIHHLYIYGSKNICYPFVAVTMIILELRKPPCIISIRSIII